ncbi:hypothetical protein LOD99_11858 [Oopsacas minuta]|uniref:Sulfotransferase domain-containing protein n=1 Tax=Oopsacas minuta TaxID=111878 RepID=A0AAV7JLC9_9METZ|nr:hypothetical protein LOD99_11858 [Oopsacas minuta]
MAERWPKFIKSWLNDYARPKLVLVYEKINNNKEERLHSIAEFLNVPILDQGLMCLQKYPNGYALRDKQVPRPKFLNPSIEHLIQEGLREVSPILMNYGIYYNLDNN